MRLSAIVLRKFSAVPATLALLALTACVDPTLGTSASGQPPLPKPDDNVYVATMDAGIPIPALPVAGMLRSIRMASSAAGTTISRAQSA